MCGIDPRTNSIPDAVEGTVPVLSLVRAYTELPELNLQGYSVVHGGNCATDHGPWQEMD